MNAPRTARDVLTALVILCETSLDHVVKRVHPPPYVVLKEATEAARDALRNIESLA